MLCSGGLCWDMSVARISSLDGDLFRLVAAFSFIFATICIPLSSAQTSSPQHGKLILNGICGINPLYLRTWTGYNWGEKPPFLCDNNYSYTWSNVSACPGSLFISCQPCPFGYTSIYPNYTGPYGTPVNPGFNIWGGSPLNCTLTVAFPGYFKNFSTTCAHLNYCVQPCNTTTYCPGGNSQPVPCAAGKTVQKTSNFFGNASDCS